MCETFFIDKTESERIAVANELKNEIDKKGGYASSDILENHKYDSIDFAFVDKHNPSIVYSVEAIIPQIDYDDFVSNIAMERTREKMSEEDIIKLEHDDFNTRFSDLTFTSLDNNTFMDYAILLEKEIWKDSKVFDKFTNTIKEYIKFDIEVEDGIGIYCMFNYKYIDDKIVKEIIDKIQKYIDDKKLSFDVSKKDEISNEEYDWYGDVIPKETIVFDEKWREINNIEMFREVDMNEY